MRSDGKREGVMADDRMSRIERENAEVLHFIETPFRWLMTCLKGVFMVAVLVGLVLMQQVGWVINLGDRSEHARDARQDRLETLLHSNGDIGGQWSVFDVDFRTQPDPTDKSIDRENRFWDDTRPLYAAQMEEDVNWKTKAFTTTWIQWGGNPGEGIPYCISAMHPDRPETPYDATPGPWDTRGDDALDRKSARMQRDYEIAGIQRKKTPAV